jgi:hypothetical protein
LPQGASHFRLARTVQRIRPSAANTAADPFYVRRVSQLCQLESAVRRPIAGISLYCGHTFPRSPLRVVTSTRTTVLVLMAVRAEESDVCGIVVGVISIYVVTV